MPTGTEVVYILPERARDRHGDPTGAAPAEIEVRGAVTWPRTSIEEGRGEVIIAGLNVFLPGGAPKPGPKDQMRARDEVYDVDGEPGTYLKGGVEKGTIVNLKKVGT